MNYNRLRIMQASSALARAGQNLADQNLEGNILNTTLSNLEKMTSSTPEQEQLRNVLMSRYRNRLLANTKTAEQQELAKQTTFAGGGLQMQAERRRLLGV